MDPIKEIEFVRKNSIFLVKVVDDGFGFLGGKIRYSLVGEPEIDESVSFVEANELRIGDIIDALSSPEVLHPLHHDVWISPVGRQGKYKMHIKWEGYKEDFIQYDTPERRELIAGLKEIEEKAAELVTLLEKNRLTVKRAYEKAYKILGLLFLETVFPGLVKGPFLKFPFRRVTIKDFKNERSFSIRLTPFEARRLCRFLSRFSP